MRILGLDIGHTSVKAVELESTFGRVSIHDRYERVISEGQSPHQVTSQLLSAIPRTPDKIVVALKTSRVTHRVKHFPNRNKRAIHANISFDLEDDLPFPADTYTYDYTILNSGKFESDVIAAATLKSTLQDQIDVLQKYGIDPDFVVPESVGYRALLKRIGQSEAFPDPLMIAHVGYERTVFFIQNKLLPVVVREVPFGGKDIHLALANKYSITIEEAEKTKLESGFVLPFSQLSTVSESQREFSETIYQCMAPFLKELRQADLSCKTATGLRVQQIWLTGGTSLLPGFPAVIAEEARCPTVLTRPLTLLDPNGQTYSEAEDSKYGLAAGIALAVTSSERAELLNFRRGEFAKKSQSSKFQIAPFKPWIKAYLYAAVIVWILSLGQNYYLETQVAESRTKLERAVKGFFVGISSGSLKNYLANTNSLAKNMDAELKKERSFVQLLTPNPYSPFDFLREISAAIPKETVNDLVSYQVQPPNDSSLGSVTGPEVNVHLEFLVSEKKHLENLNQILKTKLGQFKTQSTPEEKRTRIRIDGTLLSRSKESNNESQ